MTYDNTLRINPDLGAPMTVRVATLEDRFDKNHRLDCQGHAKVVEFYDRNYANEPGFTALGQYIACECAERIAAYGPDRLILDARVPQWAVDAKTLEKVQNWLHQLSN